MKRRIGILGGTFDPIHYGHLVAAQEAHHQLTLAQVLFVPAGCPPHKPSGAMSPSNHRVRMVELAIADDPRFLLSRVDVDRPGPSFTVDMLALLRAEWGPEVEFFFIVGSDTLVEIPTWHRPQRVIALSNLAVLPRPGVKVDLPRLEAQLPGLSDRVHWLSMPLLEISSHALRERVRTGRPITYLTPPAVETYIRAHKLYLHPSTGG